MRFLTYFYLLLLFYNGNGKCNQNGEYNSKKPLPFFRRQVEEINGNITADFQTGDPDVKLVSFLIENAKQIFDDITDENILRTWSLKNNNATSFIYHDSTESKVYFNSSPHNTPIPDDVKTYNNLKVTILPFLLDTKTKNVKDAEALSKHAEKDTFLDQPKNLQLFGEDDKALLSNITADNDTEATINLRRSCIFCNNVDNSECSDPKNKLIPSIVCENEGDQCYSLHTPFGIVDRGCFSTQNNLTTFVCNCNLCNYVSIAEMPYFYSEKSIWIQNVIELSKSRRLRNSVYKEMACLQCEVNRTRTTKDESDDYANCLEGNVATLSSQECEENEICGIKAIRSQGYVWRGCLKNPLYNYWMNLCDCDLCNYDVVVSVYDPI